MIAKKAVFSAKKLFTDSPSESLSAPIPEENVHFEKTFLMLERLQDSPFFEESTPENRYGMWQGRKIIGRDVAINGGVYLGGGVREAIVIDDEKQPELEELYQKLLLDIGDNGGDFKSYALRAVFDLVSKTLPYSSKGVEKIFQDTGAIPDQKIALSKYLRRGVGECRHQALLCGYLLERLVKEEYLAGKVSIDRNFVEGRGGHAWARYTTRDGRVVILDVAQNYLGYLKDMKVKNRKWFYERPGDKSLK
ncbi:MAG: hypothetical protein UW58_C0050G0002 [Candidatus Collierbacteria bacterium GW2011_GWC2_44_30]|nr:MAG: hypothetical protein UW58_C0050G0002 [Candidatus Collierbacteria bacterium GW2011_GWC2_44_30]